MLAAAVRPRPAPFQSCLLLLVLVACAWLAGCRREVQAPGDPVAAVKGLAGALRDNDLVRYSRLSVPPELHAQLEERWRRELAAAPPPTEAERRKFDQWMQRLTEPEAETRLYRSTEAKLRRFEAEINDQWPLMKATLSIFAAGMIQANGELGDSGKSHAEALSSALLDGLRPEQLTDRAKARRAVATVVATARGLGVRNLDESRALEMQATLEKAGLVLRGLKQLGLVYGVDADAALAAVEAEVSSVDEDIATMSVRYPLMGRMVEFEMPLQRIDGRWYDAEAVASARRKLARPVATAPAPETGGGDGP